MYKKDVVVITVEEQQMKASPVFKSFLNLCFLFPVRCDNANTLLMQHLRQKRAHVDNQSYLCWIL